MIPLGSVVKVTQLVETEMFGTDESEHRRMWRFVGKRGIVRQHLPGQLGGTVEAPLHHVEFNRGRRRTEVFWPEELERIEHKEKR